MIVLLLLISLTVTPTVSALMAKISVEDLSREADVIIIEDIKEVESRWNFWRTEVHTYSTVSVEKYIRGTGSETLTIITEGGTNGDLSVWVEDTPVFAKNEEVLDRSGKKVSLKDFLRRVEDAIPQQDVATPAVQASPEAPGFGVLMALTGLLVVMMRRGKNEH